MRGWFDAFRTDGGPTLYAYSNRTPVTGDVPTITLYILFFTLFIAFVLIFPGVRKERFTTFTSVTLSLFVGSTILVSKYGSAWHVADTSIMSYYRSFSREKVSADLGVHIGLMHFNVTFQGVSSSGNESGGLAGEDIDYNERFHWVSATEIQEEFRAALLKGLPYPILTVVEYFNMDDEGFCWGRHYREAGYYGNILLWASFASWLLMNLLIVVVPRYGAYQMVITGGIMLTTNWVYCLLIPAKPLMIRFDHQILLFKFGWCFWLVMIAGGCCVAVGGLIAVLDLIYPNKFSTILEVDYDTPYDRHIIIEDSHDTRKRKGKRSLEEPPSLGLGRKILRTLSKSKREKTEDELDIRLPQDGHENRGFEMDPPKSPWRYPNLMYPRPRDTNSPLRGALANAFAKNPALARLAAPNPISTKSPKSVSFRRQSRLETTYAVESLSRTRRSDSKDSATSSGSSGIEIPPDHHDLPTFQSQFRPIQRTASQESGSSISSFGLGLLSRTQSRMEREPMSYLSGVSGGTDYSIPHVGVGRVGSSGGPPTTLSILGMNPSHHPPLSRIHYKTEHIGIHHLPRASLERKSSEADNSNASSRRGSDESSTSQASSKPSRTGSSGFSSNSFDFQPPTRTKRLGSDSDAADPSSRRSSKEKENLRDGW